MLIEIVTFRLDPEADEAEFLEADQRVQTEFIPNRPGFLRRTTARGSDGEWAVVVLWNSEADASAAAELARDHPAAVAFTALLDRSTVRVNRYESLD